MKLNGQLVGNSKNVIRRKSVTLVLVVVSLAIATAQNACCRSTRTLSQDSKMRMALAQKHARGVYCDDDGHKSYSDQKYS